MASIGPSSGSHFDNSLAMILYKPPVKLYKPPVKLFVPPVKLHLLNLPNEIRHKIFNQACIGAYAYLFVESEGHANYVLEGIFKGPFSLLLTCSQIYAEARTVLAKQVDLIIMYNIKDLPDYYLHAQVISEAFIAPRVPIFIKYCRRFMDYVHLEPWQMQNHRSPSPYRALSLPEIFPSLKVLQLGPIHDTQIGFLTELGMVMVKEIAKRTSLIVEWRGHLLLVFKDSLFLPLREMLEQKHRKFNVRFQVALKHIGKPTVSALIADLETTWLVSHISSSLRVTRVDKTADSRVCEQLPASDRRCPPCRSQASGQTPSEVPDGLHEL
jgi:hypothetical protein